MDSQEKRTTYKASLPRVPLALRHTESCTLLPDRNALLDRLPRGGVVAEIGVAFGDFSKEIVQRTDPKCLYLIDAWEGTRFGSGLEQVEAMFKRQIETGQVELHQGYSTAILEDVPDDLFDWVYIDTDHSFDTTMAELELARRKVRPGGLIAGHDFCIGNVKKPLPYGVIEATCAFCREHDWGFEYLTVEPGGYFSYCLKEIGNGKN